MFAKEKATNQSNTSNTNYSILKPVVILGRIFGIICPLSPPKKGDKYVIKYSSLSIIYSLAVIITLVVVGLRAAYAEIEETIHSDKNTLLKYVSWCSLGVTQFVAMFYVFTFAAKIKSYQKLLLLLEEIDNVILIKNISLYARKSLIVTLSISITSFCLLAFDLTLRLLTEDRQPTEKGYVYGLLWIICNHLLYFILTINGLSFWHLVLLIKIRLSLLNEALVTEVKHSRPRLDVKTCIKVFKQGTNIEEMKVDGVKHLANRILQLSKCYRNVYAYIETITTDWTAYGIVLFMFNGLVDSIVEPYNFFRGLNSDASGIYLIGRLLWLVAHVGKMFLVVEPCQNFVREGEKSISILYDLLLTQKYDKEIEEILLSLTSNLSFCEIEFNICGCFTLNRSLLTKIAIAATTNLVILLQFN